MDVRCGVLKEDGRRGRLMFVMDAADARSFAGWLRRRAALAGVATTPLAEELGFRLVGNTSVSVRVTDAGPSLASFEEARMGGSNSVVWQIGRDRAAHAASLVEALGVDDNAAGHQYLEDAGDMEIVASVDEWAGEVWKESLHRLFRS